jgi:FtsZ-binding cell division protein ZapB
MGDWNQWLPSFILSILAYLGGLATNRAIAKKTNFEAAVISVETFNNLVLNVENLTLKYTTVMQDLTDYKQENEKLKDENKNLKEITRKLYRRMEELKIETGLTKQEKALLLETDPKHKLTEEQKRQLRRRN